MGQDVTKETWLSTVSISKGLWILVAHSLAVVRHVVRSKGREGPRVKFESFAYGYFGFEAFT